MNGLLNLNAPRFSRIHIVASHVLSQFMPSAGNLLLSVIVVRLLVPEWWGQIAVLQLYMYIAVQLCAWGNKDLLMRDFSNAPSQTHALWRTSFGNRFILIPAVCLFIPFITHDVFATAALCIWIVLRYVQQSVEVCVLFEKRFSTSIISDAAAMVFTVALVLLFRKEAGYHTVLLCITLGQMLKTVMMVSFFRSYFSGGIGLRPDFTKFRKDLPFMMLGFSGVVLQKCDMISVAWLMDDYTIATYAAFTALLLFVQTFPGLIVGPFVKNIYRVSQEVRRKMEWQFAITGLLVTTLLMSACYVAMTWIYQFYFPSWFYLLGFMYGVTAYFYMVPIYALYKAERQLKVMMVSGAGIVVNLCLCFVLVRSLGLGGALTGNMLTQLMLLVMYRRAAGSLQT